MSRCPKGHEFEYPAYDLTYQTYGPSDMPGTGRLTPVCPVCGENLY